MTNSPQDSTHEFLIGTPSEVLQRAAAHYNAAEYAAAMTICQEVVAQDPKNGEALHILGHIAAKTGAQDTAIGYFVRAVSAAPTEARFNRSFAEGLEAAGRSEQAIHAWSQYFLLQPDDTKAYLHVARLHTDSGKHVEAVALLSKACDLSPEDRDIRFTLAVAQHQAGQLDNATETYRSLLSDSPDWIAARNNLGLVLIDAGKLDEAAAILQNAARQRPDDAEIQNNLGVCQARRGDRRTALQCFNKALSLRPGWSEGHLNLANTLRQEDRLEEAVAHYQKALDDNPNDYRIHGSLALTQANLNEPDAAIASYEYAIALAPQDPELRKGLGIAQLLKGDLRNGWDNYESRLECGEQRQFSAPRWTGEDIAGDTILAYAEQGFGDTLQFCRYLKLIADRTNASRLIFECQAPLKRLLEQVAGPDSVIARGTPLPQTDYQVPLLSLPKIFGTTMETIPSGAPYLEPLGGTDADLAANTGERRRVGIVWKGNPLRQDDDKRSCPIQAFDPVAALPHIELFSLQTDADDQELAWLTEHGIVNLGNQFNDFADTAAYMAKLDLVVSVDTAAAHLAGALGKPVWVLLGASADWRYLIERENCPWYPTMRLFRQAERGDWFEVATRLAGALSNNMDT